ncbi:hypothetical protein Tcan_09925 [Toxocara canis]|uniref:Uncharacterized protein n=1 Tax=Toxocara canis TaxID=6265 RepID=A0A0B2V4D9_TOXCA|nr:hypothetical protein Tcan_09925 [Toxocara canis]
MSGHLRSVSNVEEAVPYAQSLVANGNRLIIVTPTEANVKLFSKLTNETFYIANFDSNDAVQMTQAICGSQRQSYDIVEGVKATEKPVVADVEQLPADKKQNNQN